jgi:putative ABC transport system permease protein
MLRHTLLLIYRNFKRFKSTFFINLIGLSTGLACALLIYLWVKDELSMDRFHEHDSRLFQVMANESSVDGIRTMEYTPGILAAALKDEMSDVEYATSTYPTRYEGLVTLSYKENNTQGHGLYASGDFFNTFSYHLIQGNRDKVLSDKNSIVLTKTLALKLFATIDDAVGKTIEWNHDRSFMISGIVEEAPYHSSVQFDFLVSYDVLLEGYPHLKEWGNSDPSTFVVLKRGSSANDFNGKIGDFVKRKIDWSNITLFATPYSKCYLYNHYENGVQAGGRIEYVRLFSVIAMFILVIACINFMNLSTAKASGRIKEVGVKKAIGASRKVLITQYLGESMLMSILSLFAAMLVADLFLPEFNQITGKELSMNTDMTFILSIASITIVTGLLAGSYPAFYLSGFRPAVVLKGKLHTSLGEQWARNGLVIFQFTLTVIFIASVLVVYKQIQYVQSKNLGYNKENVLTFGVAGSFENILQKREPLLSEIRNLPGVLSASSMDHASIVGDYGTTGGLDWEGKDPDVEINFQNIGINYGAIETLAMEIVEGRSFSRALSSDSSEIILNEAAAQAMGLENPVGKTVHMWRSDRKIAGIVKNFHVESLHENIKPFVLRLEPQNTNSIIVKIKPGREKETVEQIRMLYARINPGFVFDYKFMDQDFQRQYVAENRVAALSQYFAGLAILISALGLSGLAAFTAERRTKEIGIRKVLGSSEFGIILLLSADFTKIVLVSVAIALPVSFMMARSWLQSFAFKIELQWWYFIGAGCLALLIAWFTVGTQAIKAAGANPTKSLRDE